MKVKELRKILRGCKGNDDIFVSCIVFDKGQCVPLNYVFVPLHIEQDAIGNDTNTKTSPALVCVEEDSFLNALEDFRTANGLDEEDKLDVELTIEGKNNE